MTKRRQPRSAKRVDANQPEIVEALEAVGAKVWKIGYPLDLLVAFRERFHILEVKSPGKNLSTSQQETVLKIWDAGCKAYVVHSIDEALEAIGAI